MRDRAVILARYRGNAPGGQRCVRRQNAPIRSDEEKRTGTMDDSDDMQDLADFDASEFDVDAGAQPPQQSPRLSFSLTTLLM